MKGALLTAEQVAQRIGSVSQAWVRRNVPYKVQLGHSTVRWFEEDVERWLEELRPSQAVPVHPKFAFIRKRDPGKEAV